MAKKPDWDPYLICLQIVCVQCSYYLFYGLVLLACHLVFGTDLSLAHFFTDTYINFTDGWIDVVASLISAIAAYVAHRRCQSARKCPAV